MKKWLQIKKLQIQYLFYRYVLGFECEDGINITNYMDEDVVVTTNYRKQSYIKRIKIFTNAE